MTRHAEMERPDEVQEAEFARIGMASVPPSLETVRVLARAVKGLPNHRAPYDQEVARRVLAVDDTTIATERWRGAITECLERQAFVDNHFGFMPHNTHRHPYSATADRLKGRHVIRNHRAEGAAS